MKASKVLRVLLVAAVLLGLSGCASHPDQGPRTISVRVECLMKPIVSVDPLWGYRGGSESRAVTRITTNLEGARHKPRVYELKKGELLNSKIAEEVLAYYKKGMVRKDQKIILRFLDSTSFVDYPVIIRSGHDGFGYLSPLE